MNIDKVQVLYIGGSGRCGSTLLDRMLGNIGGFVSIGELRYIWDRALADNQLCGCGKPFRSCLFWTAVIEESFGCVGSLDLREIIELKRSVDRFNYTPKLAFPVFRTLSWQKNLEAYSNILYRIYNAVQRVSGCKYIVDSSKVPSHGYVINSHDGIELSVVHMVRDPRGVAFSWQRKKQRPEIHWQVEYMPKISLSSTAATWISFNILISRLGVQSRSYNLIRYEDLCNYPRKVIFDLVSRLGIESPKLDFIDGKAIDLGVNHTISGNPMRFHSGEIPIYLDDEWEQKMPSFRKHGLTLLTLPLMLRYGYFPKKNRAHL